MNMDPPSFSLRSQRCECCSGQGNLCFSTCPECGHVAVICDEVGTVFLDPKNLDEAVYGGLEDPTCVCPGCRQVHTSKFRNSTASEIQALGYSMEDYG